MNVTAIREAYGLSRGDLAKVLSCSTNSVIRWEGGLEPTGLHKAILGAMETAIPNSDPRRLLAHGGAMRALGIGDFIALAIEEMVPKRPSRIASNQE